MFASLLLLITFGLWLIPQHVIGQIPTVCTDEDSLKNLRCCPTTVDGVCGRNANRGHCVRLSISNYSRNTTNVRDNWPHYFTHVSFVYVYTHVAKQLAIAVHNK